MIIRHGQTKLNSKLILQGHMHGELDETGKKQAAAIAGEFYGTNISAIYSSDLGRAMETAEYIRERTGLRIIKDSSLRERNLGIFEGITLEDIKENYPDAYRTYISMDPDFVIPEGESIMQMYDRLIPFLNFIAAENPDRKVAVVTHSGPLDVILRHTLDVPFKALRKFTISNGSISAFSVENGAWILQEWGNIRHLRTIGSMNINI